MVPADTQRDRSLSSGRMAVICVYCASSTRIDPSYVELAAEVGREIGRRGHTLISGGGSISSMGAVARGARETGAYTIGVIPASLLAIEIADNDSDELVVAPTMRERKREMDERADAFLVLAGGIGTFEELFEIWTARGLGWHDRPVVILDPHGLYKPLRRQIEALVEQRFMRREVAEQVTWTATVAEAFLALAQVRPTPRADAAEILESEV
ncbi:MAG: hypothetical protein QOH99_476 [Frankiaceae bacterium]|nr:hypothetical protein [Frankiaceae bacterium]